MQIISSKSPSDSAGKNWRGKQYIHYQWWSPRGQSHSSLFLSLWIRAGRSLVWCISCVWWLGSNDTLSACMCYPWKKSSPPPPVTSLRIINFEYLTAWRMKIQEQLHWVALDFYEVTLKMFAESLFIWKLDWGSWIYFQPDCLTMLKGLSFSPNGPLCNAALVS